MYQVITRAQRTATHLHCGQQLLGRLVAQLRRLCHRRPAWPKKQKNGGRSKEGGCDAWYVFFRGVSNDSTASMDPR